MGKKEGSGDVLEGNRSLPNLPDHKKAPGSLQNQGALSS